MKILFLAISVFLPLVVMGNAIPLDKRDTSGTNKFRFTLKDLETIMPKKTHAASCVNKTDSTFISGCIYLCDVLDGLTKTMDDYKIYSRGEVVALLAYMMGQSVDFTINSDDGFYPGQGTYTMQIFLYNYIYCLNKHKDDLLKIKGMDDVANAIKLQGIENEDHRKLTKEQADTMNAVRDIAIRTKYDSFATASWWLAEIYPKYKDILAQDTLDAYKKYINEAYGEQFYDIYKNNWNQVTKGLAKSRSK